MLVLGLVRLDLFGELEFSRCHAFSNPLYFLVRHLRLSRRQQRVRRHSTAVVHLTRHRHLVRVRLRVELMRCLVVVKISSAGRPTRRQPFCRLRPGRWTH